MHRLRQSRSIAVTAVATAVGGFILGVALILALPSANADTDLTPPPPDPTPTATLNDIPDPEIQKLCRNLRPRVDDPRLGVPETTLYWDVVESNGIPYQPGPTGPRPLFGVDIRNAADSHDESAWKPVIRDHHRHYFTLVTDEGTWDIRIAIVALHDGHKIHRCAADAIHWSHLTVTYPFPTQASLNPEHVELTNQAVRCAYNQLSDGITRANKATFHPFITDLVHGAVNNTRSTHELTLFVLYICNPTLPDQVVLEMLQGSQYFVTY